MTTIPTSEALRYWSVRLTLVWVVLGALESQLPALQEALPPGWGALAAALVAIARVVRQPGVTTGDREE